MSTPDHLEKQAEAAMHRINRHINQSAGQHIRAVRPKVRAGQPAVIHRVDTHQLPDARTVEQHGAASTTDQHCPAGFCGFDERCTDLACPGHPAHKQQRLEGWDGISDDDDSEFGAMQMVAYALVACALTACAVIVAFAIGYTSV